MKGISSAFQTCKESLRMVQGGEEEMGEYIPEQPPERSREPVGMCRVRPL
nr:MAG TPA: hypothetical protein [Caudoviricetes sp.]